MVVIEELPDDNTEPLTVGRRTEDLPGEQPSSAKPSKPKVEPNVFCNVYDITPRINACFRRCCRSKWGIYHTGVEIHGREFAFGGHDQASTGVFCAKAKTVQGAVFREQIPIGHIQMDQRALRLHVAELSTKWPGNEYDPFKRNCNHFTDFLCQDLVGEDAPAFINRFTKSRLVRCIFHRCLVPLGRCIERWYNPKSITYKDDESSTDVGGEFCVKGARGMNQVLVEAATLQKERGNSFFRSGSFDVAAMNYMQALSYLEAMSRLDEEEEADRLVMQQAGTVCVALLLNIAACNLKNQDYQRAVLCCEQVMKVEPESQKALFRRGVAFSHLGRTAEALSDLKKAYELTDKSDEATTKHIKQELDRVTAMLE